jgi:hypothetical protein
MLICIPAVQDPNIRPSMQLSTYPLGLASQVFPEDHPVLVSRQMLADCLQCDWMFPTHADILQWWTVFPITVMHQLDPLVLKSAPVGILPMPLNIVAVSIAAEPVQAEYLLVVGLDVGFELTHEI